MTTGIEERYALYGTRTCPYCVLVLRVLAGLDLEVPFRDTTSPEYRRELIEATKRTQVPVLRIETDMGTRWMPESADIIRYLKERAGVPPSKIPEFVVPMLGAGALACLIFGMVMPAAKIPLWSVAAVAFAARAYLRWRV